MFRPIFTVCIASGAINGMVDVLLEIIISFPNVSDMILVALKYTGMESFYI